ncbi:hypothetical protein BGZ95_006677, partial [Linnemannia exigua]
RPSIGVVVIPTHSVSLRREAEVLEDGFAQLYESGVRNVILDLTGNGGGYVNFAYDLVDWMFPDVNETSVYVSDLRTSMSVKALAQKDLEWEEYNSYFNPSSYSSAVTGVEYETNFFMQDKLLRRVNRQVDYSPKVRMNHNLGAFERGMSWQHDASRIVVMTDGTCGSACGMSLNRLKNRHGVKSYAIGGRHGEDLSLFSFPGASVYSLAEILRDFEVLEVDPPMQLPRYKGIYRVPVMQFFDDDETRPIEFRPELYKADFHLDYTPLTARRHELLWEIVANNHWAPEEPSELDHQQEDFEIDTTSGAGRKRRSTEDEQESSSKRKALHGSSSPPSPPLSSSSLLLLSPLSSPEQILGLPQVEEEKDESDDELSDAVDDSDDTSDEESEEEQEEEGTDESGGDGEEDEEEEEEEEEVEGGEDESNGEGEDDNARKVYVSEFLPTALTMENYEPSLMRWRKWCKRKRYADSDTVTREKLIRYAQEGTAREAYVDKKNPHRSIEPFMTVSTGKVQLRSSRSTVSNHLSAVRALYKKQQLKLGKIPNVRKNLGSKEATAILNEYEEWLRNPDKRLKLVSADQTEESNRLREREAKRRQRAKREAAKLSKNNNSSEKKVEDDADVALQGKEAFSQAQWNTMSGVDLNNAAHRVYYRNWKEWCARKRFSDGERITREKAGAYAVEMAATEAYEDKENPHLSIRPLMAYKRHASIATMEKNMSFVRRLFARQCEMEGITPDMKKDFWPVKLEAIIQEYEKLYADGERVTGDKHLAYAKEIMAEKAYYDKDRPHRNIEPLFARTPTQAQTSRRLGVVTLQTHVNAIRRLYRDQCSMEGIVPNMKRDLRQDEVDAVFVRYENFLKKEGASNKSNSGLIMRRQQDSEQTDNDQHISNDKHTSNDKNRFRAGFEFFTYDSDHSPTTVLASHLHLIRVESLEDQRRFTTGVAMDKGMRKAHTDQERYSIFLRESDVEICPIGALAFYLLAMWKDEGTAPNFRTWDWENDRLLTIKSVSKALPTLRQVPIVSTSPDAIVATLNDSRLECLTPLYHSGSPHKQPYMLVGTLQEPSAFEIPRSKVIPPAELQRQLFPFVEEFFPNKDDWRIWIDNVMMGRPEGTNRPKEQQASYPRVSYPAIRLLLLLAQLRRIILQDYAVLMAGEDEHSGERCFDISHTFAIQHPVFSSSAFRKFASRLRDSTGTGSAQLTRISTASASAAAASAPATGAARRPHPMDEEAMVHRLVQQGIPPEEFQRPLSHQHSTTTFARLSSTRAADKDNSTDRDEDSIGNESSDFALLRPVLQALNDKVESLNKEKRELSERNLQLQDQLDRAVARTPQRPVSGIQAMIYDASLHDLRDQNQCLRERLAVLEEEKKEAYLIATEATHVTETLNQRVTELQAMVKGMWTMQAQAEAKVAGDDSLKLFQDQQTLLRDSMDIIRERIVAEGMATLTTVLEKSPCLEKSPGLDELSNLDELAGLKEPPALEKMLEEISEQINNSL